MTNVTNKKYEGQLVHRLVHTCLSVLKQTQPGEPEKVIFKGELEELVGHDQKKEQERSEGL